MRDNSSRSLGGIFLIIIGVLFLFESFHILDFGPLFSHWWPLFIIGVGLIKMKGHDKTGGAIMFVIGVGFLSATLDIINWGTLFALWPIIIIVIGLSMMSKRRHAWWDYHASDESSADFVTAKTLFGGIDRVVTSPSLKSADIQAIFGGIEIDFRNTIVDGDSCIIHLTAVFGGIEMKIPRNWEVDVSGSPIFGAIEDSTRYDERDGSPVKVEIRCSATFGSIEIRN